MPYQPRPRRTMPTTVLCQVMPRRTMSTTMHCAELAPLLSGCPCSAREGRNIQPSILHSSILHPYYTHPYYTHPYCIHTTPMHTTPILHPSIYIHTTLIHTTPILHLYKLPSIRAPSVSSQDSNACSFLSIKRWSKAMTMINGKWPQLKVVQYNQNVSLSFLGVHV